MRIVDLIEKKKRGKALTSQEISSFINGYVSNEIPDYQVSALLMAIWFQGMNAEETRDLTLSMAHSGEMVDLSGIPGIKVDKHSTGGVADTTTLVAAPIVAACGGRVAKMSGRGLGHTGGTLDKLESIPGLCVDQDMDSFIDLVNSCGISVIGQTADLVPADKKLYALRDVTGTVDNVSLIAASIMSKKIASGSDAIVLDVKTGSGAFMQSSEDAFALAESMVSIGNLAGRKTVALVTEMGQPLGNAIGNALEVQEAIEILRGNHRGDLREVSLALAARMLVLSELYPTVEDAETACNAAIEDGSAIDRLALFIKGQGGDASVVSDLSLLPKAETVIPVTANTGGYMHGMATDRIGLSALLLGAGRSKKEDTIDPSVGIWMRKRVGDAVQPGDVLAEFHVGKSGAFDEASEIFIDAIQMGDTPIEPPPLIHGVVE